MASVLSRIVRRVTGRSIGENIGGAIGGTLGGPAGAAIGAEIGGATTKELANISARPDTTTTTNPPPATQVMPNMTGPAQAIEIDFSGAPTMPGPYLSPAVLRVPQIPQQGMQMTTPVRGGAVGTAVGIGATAGAFIMDLFSGQPVKLIITRKLKRETQELMELFMNDMDAVAEQLSALKGKEFTAEIVLMILMKKFTNQGPYVTKAAVRKTRQTVRKLQTLKKLEAEICKPTTRRRAAPRASMTKTSIVKA
jgi:hypothetical protein